MLTHRLTDDHFNEHGSVKVVTIQFLEKWVLYRTKFLGGLDELSTIYETLSNEKVNLLTLLDMASAREQEHRIDERNRAATCWHTNSRPNW